MPLPVALDEVVDQLEALSTETGIFVNRKTGEVVTVSLEDLGAVEAGLEDETELEDGEESLALLRSIAETEDWVSMPDQFDVHEWEIMRRFAESRPGGLSAELSNAIRGSGAFRRFKDVLYRHGAEDAWFDFKRQALRQIAAEALEEEGIPYR